MNYPSHMCEAFCHAVNKVKRSALSAHTLELNQYLGGDLGIDSIEMLEIWFLIEKHCETQIPDEAKRDIYTVAEVLQVIYRYLPIVEEDELENEVEHV